MSQTNPYAYADQVPAAQAAVEERVAFLRRTYSLLLAAILTFAATLWAAGNVEPVREMAGSLAQVIFKSKFGWFLYAGLFLGGSWIVHAFADKKPVNVVLFFGFAFLMGLLVSPVLYMVLGQANGLQTINQAALLTALVFTGLSAYVFFSGRSFSFLGGALTIASIALFGGGLIAWWMDRRLVLDRHRRADGRLHPLRHRRRAAPLPHHDARGRGVRALRGCHPPVQAPAVPAVPPRLRSHRLTPTPPPRP